MRLLLDTHALLWWWSDDPQLPGSVRTAVADEANDVFVSAGSAWEIATRQRIGKLPLWPMPAGGFTRIGVGTDIGVRSSMRHRRAPPWSRSGPDPGCDIGVGVGTSLTRLRT